MTTTATERAQINRRNARRSTGPKTAAGKERSKFNALKHGLDARTVVLPTEDPEAFEGRLEDWKAGLKPRNAVEDYLVEHAVELSWQM